MFVCQPLQASLLYVCVIRETRLAPHMQHESNVSPKTTKCINIVFLYKPFAFAASVIFLTTTAVRCEVQFDKFDRIERCALISAFEPERSAIHRRMQVLRTLTRNGTTFDVGTLDGRNVVLFSTGVGMVNAAMTTQLALDTFNISNIVLSGIAGGADPKLHIGDVVVASKWAQYLNGILAPQTSKGYRLPTWAKSIYPNFGSFFAQPVTLRSGSDLTQKAFWWAVNSELFVIAKRAAATTKLRRCLSNRSCLKYDPKVVLGGPAVSGSMFVDNVAFRRYIHTVYAAEAVDTETAAVSATAYSNGVPFIAVRNSQISQAAMLERVKFRRFSA